MKKIRIKKLSLTNFKGQTQKVEFTDNTSIFGKNKCGKTTLVLSTIWLWTGYCGYCKQNFELYNNKIEITPDTPIAEVCGVYEIDGYEYEIKRTAKAKFLRKRGSDEWEKANSDEYKIYIDSIEYSLSDFKNWITKNICDYNVLQYCLSGEFFTRLADDKWEEARHLLENLVGKIDKKDFIGNYDYIFEQFNIGKTINEIKTHNESKKKPIKERLKVLPSIIEEVERDLSSYDNIDFDTIEHQISLKRKEIDEIDKKIAGITDSIKPFIEKRNQELKFIGEKENELNSKKIEYDRKYQYELETIQTQKSTIFSINKSIKEKNLKRKEEYEALLKKQDLVQTQYDLYNKNRHTLKEMYEKNNGIIFEYDKCYHCGQDLPIEKSKELKEKFNLDKKASCDAILLKAKNNKELFLNAKNELEQINTKIEEGCVQEDLKATEEIDEILKEFKDSWIPFNQTEVYISLNNEIMTLKESITTVPKDDSQECLIIKESLMNEINELNKELGKEEILLNTRNRINELKEEQREQANELAQIERIEQMIKNYEQERSQITSNRINEKLNICRIEVEKRQKDGTYKPDLVITDLEGVKLSTINRASHSLITIDIQRMFCNYYGINMPLFIDDSESFDDENQPVYEGWQTIRLFVSNDKQLIIK